MKLFELGYHGVLSVDIKLSERLASFVFEIEALFSKTNCPPIKLHHLLEALNKNTNGHENHQIYGTVYFKAIFCSTGDHGSTVVNVMCYQSEGRWFDSRWCHWNPSDRTMALGSTQPLTQMSTNSISWG